MKAKPKKRYFGTDGIRGRVGGPVINADFVMRLGLCLGQVLGKKQGSANVIVGRDTRLSGDMLEAALASGLLSAGANVWSLGVSSTPCISYSVRKTDADLGVVISASHNPYADNGIKLFDGDGDKLSADVQDLLEFELQKEYKKNQHQNLGKMQRQENLTCEYEDYCQNSFQGLSDFLGLSIVLDCANGATFNVAPRVFEKLGFAPIYLGVNPDGTNINKGCGSTDTTLLQKTVMEKRADLGIAFDGDGDRLIMVDEFGGIVDGDELIYALASWKRKLGTLTGGVVGTHMTNLGLELALADINVPFVRSNVGDRYVMDKLKEKKWALGGETSGHIINLDTCHTGDAIINALQILEIIGLTALSLSELVGPVEKLPQVLINVPTKNPNAIMSSEKLAKKTDAFRRELGDDGRILIRSSGTEPLVRVMVEGRDRAQSVSIAQELSQIVKLEERV